LNDLQMKESRRSAYWNHRAIDGAVIVISILLALAMAIDP